MINSDYSPETAHLPSARDNELWRNGGREKEKQEREKLARVRAKWDAAEQKKIELIRLYERQLICPECKTPMDLFGLSFGSKFECSCGWCQQL